jgi:hypothetical protein
MQFIKKNYEKILLGLVLIGLVAVALFSIFLVSNERQKQEDRRTQILIRPVTPLTPPDLSPAEALLKRAQTPVDLNLSDTTNKLFNPIRWQKANDGHVFKNPVGDTPHLEITRISPLYLVIGLDSVNVSDAGARYVISVEQQAALRQNHRGKTPFYVSVGDKKEYGEKKDTFTLREVRGETNTVNAEIVLDLSDSPDKPVVISGKDKPFKRVDGYVADLRYIPEDRKIPARHVGDKITLAGEDYNIVAISENEVVISAKSNQKKWTIKYSAAP